MEKMHGLVKAERLIRETNHQGIKLDHWFRRDGNAWNQLPPDIQREFHVELWPLIETNFKYEGHLGRQQVQIDRMVRHEEKRLPKDVDYSTVKGLKKEAQGRFGEILPETLGQAARIPGITPADIAILLVWLEGSSRQRSKLEPQAQDLIGHEV